MSISQHTKNTRKRSGAPYGAPSTNEKYFERYVKMDNR